MIKKNTFFFDRWFYQVFLACLYTPTIDSKNSIRAIKFAVSIFGAPTRIIADQERSFASREFREFCDSSNVQYAHYCSRLSSQVKGLGKKPFPMCS